MKNPPKSPAPPPLPPHMSGDLKERILKTPPKRIVINLSVWATGIVMGVITLAIVALVYASASFMVEATKAISGTTLLCADRMLVEVEARHATDSENQTLRLQVIGLSAKVDLFNDLYGLSKKNYRESIGGQ